MLELDVSALNDLARAVTDIPRLRTRAMALEQFSKVMIESGQAGDLETARRLSLVFAADGSAANLSKDQRYATVPQDLPFAVLAARRLAQEGKRFRITLSSFSPAFHS